MASLNLPAALEDVGGDRVPQSLLDKGQQIKDMGGVSYIEKLMSDLPVLLTRNKEILDEVMYYITLFLETVYNLILSL